MSPAFWEDLQQKSNQSQYYKPLFLLLADHMHMTRQINRQINSMVEETDPRKQLAISIWQHRI